MQSIVRKAFCGRVLPKNVWNSRTGWAAVWTRRSKHSLRYCLQVPEEEEEPNLKSKDLRRRKEKDEEERIPSSGTSFLITISFTFSLFLPYSSSKIWRIRSFKRRTKKMKRKQNCRKRTEKINLREEKGKSAAALSVANSLECTNQQNLHCSGFSVPGMVPYFF